MPKSPFVLQALGILGLEEILNLTQVLQEMQVPLKKAAGEELIVWNNAPERSQSRSHQAEARVLDFPNKKVREFQIETPVTEQEHPESTKKMEDHPQAVKVIPTDLLLWQREIAKESGEAIQKIDAMKGYQKSTQMYVVKTQTVEGKEKLRFASTDGILVNKKQA